MLVQDQEISKYLQDFKEGKITLGDGIGINQADD